MKNKKIWTQAFILSVLFLTLLTLMWGCGDNSISSDDNGNGNGNGSNNVSLSIKTDNVTDNPASIIIEEAKGLITEVEIEQEPSGTGHHIRINPFVVYFNLNGALITVTSGTVPSGMYNKIKFKIHKPEDNETPPDPEFKEGPSGNQRFSFIIKGKFNGQSFVYKSRKTANLVVIFPFPINMQEIARNITVLVNPLLWFKNGLAELDPRDPNNADIIDNNIKNSFKRAFKDDNKDGLPDDN